MRYPLWMGCRLYGQVDLGDRSQTPDFESWRAPGEELRKANKTLGIRGFSPDQMSDSLSQFEFPKWTKSGRIFFYGSAPPFLKSFKLLRLHGQNTSWKTWAPRSIRVCKSAQSPASSKLECTSILSPAPSPGLAIRGLMSLMELLPRSSLVS